MSLAVLALIVTKLVDTLRNAFDPSGRAPKVTWNLIAFGIGIAVAFIWTVQTPIPVDTPIQDGAARVLVGLGLGAAASGLHELLDMFSGIAKAGHRR